MKKYYRIYWSFIVFFVALINSCYFGNRMYSEKIYYFFFFLLNVALLSSWFVELIKSLKEFWREDD